MTTYDYGQTQAFELFLRNLRARGAVIVSVDIHYGHIDYIVKLDTEFTKSETNELFDMFVNKDLIQFEVDGCVAKISAKTRHKRTEEPKAGFFRRLLNCFQSN